MTEREINNVRRVKRLPLNWEFWFNVVLGTCIFGGVFFGIGMIVFKEFGIENNLGTPYLFVVCIAFFWRYWESNKTREIENSYTKSTNFTRTRECLKKMDWEHWSIQGVVYVGTNKFFLHFLHVTIIPTEKGILYNFQYKETRGIRLPFFIGIRTYARRKFEKNCT